MIGNSGVLQGITAGKGYVEMSTVDTDTVKEISEVGKLFLVKTLYVLCLNELKVENMPFKKRFL